MLVNYLYYESGIHCHGPPSEIEEWVGKLQIDWGRKNSRTRWEFRVSVKDSVTRAGVLGLNFRSSPDVCL
jgi:hypothetical protein